MCLVYLKQNAGVVGARGTGAAVEVDVSHLRQVLGTELAPSSKEVCTFTAEHSLQPFFIYYILYSLYKVFVGIAEYILKLSSPLYLITDYFP